MGHERSARWRDRILPSFRARMRLFFVVVVVAPTIAVTLVLFGLIAASERGQGDARLASRQGAAIRLGRAEQRRAERAARVVVSDAAVAAAVRAGETGRLEAAVRRAATGVDARRIVIRQSGEPIADIGSVDATLPAAARLTSGGRIVATIELSLTTAAEFAALTRSVTEDHVVIRQDDKVLAATGSRFEDAPVSGATETVDVGGRSYRTAAFTVPGFGPQRMQVALFDSVASTESRIARARLLALIFVLGFVLVALIAGSIVTRSLQREIETFLQAARRLGRGDFAASVPTRGRDEFAQLGQEFNAMSTQLQQRLDDLRQERIRLARSLRRLGEAFASNLDRTALLEIVVETAIDTLDADGGRARLREHGEGPFAVVASVGSLGGARDAVRNTEEQVLIRDELVAVEQDDGNAVGYPLHTASQEEHDETVGVVVVWREGRPFSGNERELFEYLASQAAVSVVNVGRHELAAHEAVTDPLTGLANRRRFDQRLEHEVERARSLGTDVALVMLDIDDFKQVNDTYGHAAGDEVLQRIADVLTSSARDPDTPGRLGGEELAVVLPGADLAGAHEVAERIRSRVEQLTFAGSDGAGGASFRVTASLGVAVGRGGGASAEKLLADSDGALYEAKRAGKNRVVTAS